MASNRLKLNEKKTELLYLQSRFKKTSDQPTAMTIGNDTVTFSKSVRNLGFMFDETMKMDAQISHMSKASYAVIRKISLLRKYLDGPTTEKLVHAFLTSRLDYCNRGIREAIHIARTNPPLNRDRGRHHLPSVYDSILKSRDDYVIPESRD